MNPRSPSRAILTFEPLKFKVTVKLQTVTLPSAFKQERQRGKTDD